MALTTIERVRAARGAVNMSLDDFAEAIGIGRSTLVRIENGTNSPTVEHYAAMARVSGLPLGFFVVEDLEAALSDEPEPALADRVEKLEREMHTVLRRLATEAPPAPPGAGQHQPTDARSNESSLGGTNPEEPDAQPGTER